jgi:GGDEF domain-containing protein
LTASKVNDTLGHAAGEAMLKAAAERIKSSIGIDGIVGRLGSDEFAVVLPGLGDPTAVPEFCGTGCYRHSECPFPGRSKTPISA